MKKILYLILSLSIFWSTRGIGDEQTGNINVQATILGTCSLTLNTGTIDFGSLEPNETQNASTLFSVNCTNGTPYTLYIPYSGASSYTLTKSGSTETLDYSLFQPDSPYPSTTCVYTSPTDFPITSGSLGTTGDGLDQNWAICAELSAPANPTAGNYADTITLHVDFTP